MMCEQQEIVGVISRVSERHWDPTGELALERSKFIHYEHRDVTLSRSELKENYYKILKTYFINEVR